MKCTVGLIYSMPGMILRTRSMTPWPTVPLPPIVARPAALITSCSLSAMFICRGTHIDDTLSARYCLCRAKAGSCTFLILHTHVCALNTM